MILYSNQPFIKTKRIAFLASNKHLYIPNPIDPQRLADYHTPRAYNQREHIPTYVNIQDVQHLFVKELPIDPISLTVKRPEQ